MILQMKHGQSVTVGNLHLNSFINAARHLGIETRKEVVSGCGAAKRTRIWFLPNGNVPTKTDQDSMQQKIKELQRDNWRLSRALKAIVSTGQELKSILGAAEDLLRSQVESG